MDKRFYLILAVFLMAGVFAFTSGCAKKETVVESSAPPQTEMKQEAAEPPKPEEVKPAPEAVKPVTEGEQKMAAAETAKSLEDIHFDYDMDVLRPEDRTILNAHANWLQKNADYQVTVEGNCDERGTDEYNLALGQRRADNAKKYLIETGVDGQRITTISYGKERPVDPEHNEAAWAKNRNDHFVLSK